MDFKTFFKANFRQYSMFVALAVIWLMFGALTDWVFLKPRNLSNLFLQTSYITILAVGMVLVIVAGHIDLSVGSIAGFIGAVAAIVQVQCQFDTVSAVAISLLLGVVIGAWQGYWVAYREVPAFIVTLAGMLCFRGAVIAITGGETVGPLDDSFKALGQGYLPRLFWDGYKDPHDFTIILLGLALLTYVFMEMRNRKQRKSYGLEVLPFKILLLKMAFIIALMIYGFSIVTFYRGVPYALIIVTLVVGVLHFVSLNTIFGRYIYAIGGSKEAAKYSGINIKKVNMGIFLIMGVLSALAGLVFTARLNSASSNAGTLFELDAIAAAIIGGTSTLGGEGSVIGAVLGALIMATISNGMTLMNIPTEYQYIVKGLVLILAVWFDIHSRKKIRFIL